jgi:hypothetical protein
MGERSGVAKFGGAWPNDSAQREQVQGFFLLSACLPIVGPSCQWHRSISCGTPAVLMRGALHPKHFPEILIDASGTVAMGASRKQCRVFRSKRRTKNDLIDVPPAGRAGFASDLSANGSDLADLFLHLLPPCPGLFLMSYPLGAGGVRIGAAVRAGNTVEVGVHQPKEGSVPDFCCSCFRF